VTSARINQKNKMKSAKTTVLGIITILGAVLAAARALLDADPATVPDLAVTMAAISAGLGLIAARDNNVTSEQVGLK